VVRVQGEGGGGSVEAWRNACMEVSACMGVASWESDVRHTFKKSIFWHALFLHPMSVDAWCFSFLCKAPLPPPGLHPTHTPRAPPSPLPPPES
jgi:hypothetical protein